MSFTKRFAEASKILQKGVSPDIRILPRDLPKVYLNTVAEHQMSKPAGQTWAYGDYENSQVKFDYQDDYELLSKLGRGRYSEVFKAVNLLTQETAVIKILKPGKKSTAYPRSCCSETCEDKT